MEVNGAAGGNDQFPKIAPKCLIYYLGTVPSGRGRCFKNA